MPRAVATASHCSCRRQRHLLLLIPPFVSIDCNECTRCLTFKIDAQRWILNRPALLHSTTTIQKPKAKRQKWQAWMHHLVSSDGATHQTLKLSEWDAHVGRSCRQATNKQPKSKKVDMKSAFAKFLISLRWVHRLVNQLRETIILYFIFSICIRQFIDAVPMPLHVNALLFRQNIYIYISIHWMIDIIAVPYKANPIFVWVIWEMIFVRYWIVCKCLALFHCC